MGPRSWRKWNYCPSLDRWQHQWMDTIVRRRLERCLVWYRHRGYRVFDPQDIQTVPVPVREQLVAAIGRRWSHWLLAETLAGAAGGPLGLVVGIPALIVVLTAWGTEVALAYGIDMREPTIQNRLQSMLDRELRRMLMMPQNPRPSHWVARGLYWVETVASLNFGQDLRMADRIMGRIRRVWRRESAANPA